MKRKYTYEHMYKLQKYDAKKRGIKFLFTFEEWLKVWIDSGHLHERGPRKGQYVMARNGDRGPYAIGNVHIVTAEQNRVEQKLTKKTRNRMSRSAKIRAQYFSPEHRKKISYANRGEKNAQAKLTEEEVREIRRVIFPGSRSNGYAALGRRYKVSGMVIKCAVNKISWRHVV